MKLKNSKVLVTGAGGFIGSHLSETLAGRCRHLRVLVHYNSRNDWGKLEELPKKVLSDIEVVSGDITDSFFCRKITRDIDVVLHLAAAIAIPFSYIAPHHYVLTNVCGTLNMLEASLRAGVKKFVHTSTSEVYGTAQYTPIDEKHPLVGQSPYSASKIGADKLAESYFCSYNLPVAVIRPFNTFGPRQSARAIIPTIISQIFYNKNKKIRIGDTSPVRDFTYVKDTVEGYICIAESDKSVGETINIGSGKGYSIKEILEIIGDVTDKKDIKVMLDRKRVRPSGSEVYKLVCDNTKAKNLLKWQPGYTLRAGIEETAHYIKENIHRYKPWMYNL